MTRKAFPPTASASKPGMVMGMVLASVPTLGKVLGEGNKELQFCKGK